MTKAPVKEHQEPEIRPDGWERFEKAVDVAVKGGPARKRPAAQPSTLKTKEPSGGPK